MQISFTGSNSINKPTETTTTPKSTLKFKQGVQKDCFQKSDTKKDVNNKKRYATSTIEKTANYKPSMSSTVEEPSTECSTWDKDSPEHKKYLEEEAKKQEEFQKKLAACKTLGEYYDLRNEYYDEQVEPAMGGYENLPFNDNIDTDYERSTDTAVEEPSTYDTKEDYTTTETTTWDENSPEHKKFLEEEAKKEAKKHEEFQKKLAACKTWGEYYELTEDPNTEYWDDHIFGDDEPYDPNWKDKYKFEDNTEEPYSTIEETTSDYYDWCPTEEPPTEDTTELTFKTK